MSGLRRPAPAAHSRGEMDFDQAPPLWVPFLFFLTAPVFLLLAALVTGWNADSILASRWSPPALAATHLLTLGFLAQIMAGALFQVLPVVASARVAFVGRVAIFVHAAIAGGALALAVGFLLQSDVWLRAAAALLGPGWAIFIVATGTAAWQAPTPTPSVLAIRFALVALLVTAVLGLVLLGALAAGLDIAVLSIVSLHSGWGLVGWIALLIAGVAYQVVPMFQLTPQYAAWIKRSWAPAGFALLCLWTLAAVTGRASALPAAGIALLLAGFAVATLRLQAQRRRRIADVTVRFWQFGMVCLTGAALLWLAGLLYPAWPHTAAFPTLIAALFLLGFAASVMNGMLYKIAPFLVWFHLSSRLGVRGVPLMNAIIPVRWARRHYWLHLGAVILALVAALTASGAVLVAAAALLASGAAILVGALAGACRVYLRYAPRQVAAG